MPTPRILVDADACPVKEEIYKVAWRHEVPVVVVSNQHLRVPAHPLLSRQVVSDAFDAADDWIAGQADARAVVITGDILLADRCLRKGAAVIAHKTGVEVAILRVETFLGVFIGGRWLEPISSQRARPMS